jgi:hypothetical protein
MAVDAYWIYSGSGCDWDLEITQDRRYVLTPITDPRTSHKGRRERHNGNPQAARCGCSDGVKPSVHGYARCGENKRKHDHELRIGMHREKTRNEFFSLVGLNRR